MSGVTAAELAKFLGGLPRPRFTGGGVAAGGLEVAMFSVWESSCGRRDRIRRVELPQHRDTIEEWVMHF